MVLLSEQFFCCSSFFSYSKRVAGSFRDTEGKFSHHVPCSVSWVFSSRVLWLRNSVVSIMYMLKNIPVFGMKMDVEYHLAFIPALANLHSLGLAGAVLVPQPRPNSEVGLGLRFALGRADLTFICTVLLSGWDGALDKVFTRLA